MKRSMTWGAVTAAFLVAGAASGGDAARPSIEHKAGSCVRPGVWPRIEAKVSASEAPRVNVVFHAADSPHWYTVEMKADDGVWSATLPRPTAVTSRFGYFLLATDKQGEARLPAASAFVVDVDSRCDEAQSLPSGERGPAFLGLVGAAPREAPGFDVGVLQGVIEGMSVVTPIRPPGSASVSWMPPLGGKLRIRTVSPKGVHGSVARQDGGSVTLRLGETEELVTFTKNDWLEGEIAAIDDEGLVLAVPGKGRVRVRREDVVRMESYKPGSTALGVVGGLTGVGAGLLATALVCLSADVCDNAAPLWLGMLAGAGLGAAAGGAGDWQAVPVLGRERVSLAFKPVARGGAVGVQIGF